MTFRTGTDDAHVHKVGLPVAASRVFEASLSEPPRQRRKPLTALASPQRSSRLRGSASSSGVIHDDSTDPTNPSKHRGTVSTSSGPTQPRSLEARLDALRERRLGRVARASATSVSQPVALLRRPTESSAWPRPWNKPSTSSPPSMSPTLATEFADRRFTMERTLSEEIGKATSATSDLMMREPRFESSHGVTSSTFTSNGTSRTRASITAATAERPTQARWMVPSGSASFNSSTVSTSALSEAHVSNCPSIVFSASDSPPSHPFGPAPMIYRETSPRETTGDEPWMTASVNPKRQLMQRAKQRPAAEVSSFPCSPIDNADVAHQPWVASTECFISRPPVDTTLGAIRVTVPDSREAEHTPHARFSDVVRSVADQQHSGNTPFATPPAPKLTKSSLGVEPPITSFKNVGSSATLSTSARDIGSRLNGNTAHRRTAIDPPPTTSVNPIDSVAPLLHPRTTTSRETTASPHSPPECKSWQDWRDSMLTGAYYGRDCLHTQRTRSTSREPSHTGRGQTACGALSPGVGDGELRAVSADHHTSRESEFSGELPVSCSPRNRLSPAVTSHVTPPPSSPVSACRSFPSSALYHAFLATTVRFKYKLLDDDTTMSTAASAVSDTIAAELEMQRRLNRLKSGLTRKGMEQWRYLDQIRTS